MSSFGDGRPVYCVSLELLADAYRNLITENHPKDGIRAELGAIAYPKVNEHSPVHLRFDNDDLGRCLVDMDIKDYYLYSWIHNHPGKGYLAASPSAVDVPMHMEFEIFIDGKQVPVVVGPSLGEHMKIHTLKLQ